MSACSSLIAFLLLPALTPPARAQTAAAAPERNAQAVSLLQNALAAMTGGAAVQDATFTGTVRRIAGSLDESGVATLKGTAAGASLTEFDLPSGTFEESRDLTAVPAAGAWEKAGGTAQPIPFHNLATDPTWFYPALLVERSLASAAYGIAYLGPATKNGASAVEVRINSYPLGPPAKSKGLAETLGRMDLYLDAKTGLPIALDFNAHADSSALINLSVEIRYLNYARQGGALVPSEIQKYLDNSLLLDIQVTSAQFNAGLTSGALALQ